MTKEYIVCVNPGLTFTPTFLPIAGVDTAYSADIEARNGQAPYEFTLTTGSLPSGVTFTDNGDGTATFAGTPTAAGSFDVVIRLRDVFRRPRERTYTLQVVALPLSLSGSLADMTVGTPYSDTLTISGGVSPYSLGSIVLPAGLSASVLGSTITVSGTPTGAGLGPGYSKSFGVSFTVTDDDGGSIPFAQTVSITVNPVVWAPTYPAGSESVPYDYTPAAATGGTGGYTYSYTGTLPTGLSFVTGSGRLHGTPTDDSGSPFAFTVTATDSEGNASGGAAQSVVIAASDPDFASVSALLHFDGADGSTTFTDVIGNTWTPAGSAQLDTAFFKWGTASMLHGGSGYHISTASNARFGFGSGDYTLEGWFRYTATTGYQCLLDTRTGSNEGIAVYVSTTGGGNAGKLAVYSNAAFLARSTVQFTVDVWQHWAVVNDGGTLYGYVDGVMVFSIADGRTLASASTCFFGDNYLAPSQPTQGNSDDFRVTKGVCRYPGGTTFTPPTAAFPNS